MPTWIEQPHDEFFDLIIEGERQMGFSLTATEPERDVLEWHFISGEPIARIEYIPRFPRKAFYLEQAFLERSKK